MADLSFHLPDEACTVFAGRYEWGDPRLRGLCASTRSLVGGRPARALIVRGGAGRTETWPAEGGQGDPQFFEFFLLNSEPCVAGQPASLPAAMTCVSLF